MLGYNARVAKSDRAGREKRSTMIDISKPHPNRETTVVCLAWQNPNIGDDLLPRPQTRIDPTFGTLTRPPLCYYSPVFISAQYNDPF